MSNPKTSPALLIFVLLVVAITTPSIAAADTDSVDLSSMNLEDLMNVKVTSVSKHEQKLSHTAAAIYVISSEDIRRSGATNIPDLLRMAPGVDVEQIDANAWAISIRGFNSRYSNKVLVLIDGRTVYTPSFSGVFWEQIDMPLGNIDRIEIIRGPGASVWGANAVNGVISIITRKTTATGEGAVVLGAGTQINALGHVQYGGTLGKEGTYRVFGKAVETGNSSAANGSTANDHWMRAHAGFRYDREHDRDSYTVLGELFTVQASQTRRLGFVATPADIPFHQSLDAAGGDLLARWTHTFASGSQTTLQAYYDSYRRTEYGVPEILKTFDLDFQHHLTAGDRNDIVWGLGYRVNDSGVSPGYSVALTPPYKTDSLYNVFFQDEIRLSDAMWLTLGGKLDHYAIGGFESEPNVRLLWAPTASRYAFWASASKAVRQPARIDQSITTNISTVPLDAYSVLVSRLIGNPLAKDEELRDYEIGYRAEWTKSLSVDATTFFSQYRHVQTLEPQSVQFVPGIPFQVVVPLLYENKASATTYGGEVSINWNVTHRWRLSPGYAYLHATIRRDPSSQGTTAAHIETDFPQNTAQFRSLLNLSRRIEFDQSLYYTARLPGGTVPGHARLDLRLARKLGESAELSLVGQNLLRPRTFEYGDALLIVGTQSERSVYAKLMLHF